MAAVNSTASDHREHLSRTFQEPDHASLQAQLQPLKSKTGGHHPGACLFRFGPVINSKTSMQTTVLSFSNKHSVEATPKTPVQRRKSEATREALLEAARIVIARDGYTNARIVDIAREAGKSAGVFYSYFEDKTQLFSALVDAFYEDVKRVTPTLQEYEDNPTKAVKNSVDAFWHAYRHFHPEMVGLLESALSDPALLEVWRNIRQRGIRRFTYRIKKQQSLGKCIGMDPELSATALQGMLEFTCFNWHSEKLDFPGKRISDEKATNELYQIISRVLEL